MKTAARDNRQTFFISKREHEEESVKLLFTPNEKDFIQIQEVNRKRIPGCTKLSKRSVMYRKFPASRMILAKCEQRKRANTSKSLSTNFQN